MSKRTNQYTGKWTPQEDAYLREHYSSMTSTQISAALGRTRTAVTSRLSNLRLLRGETIPWNHADEDFLRQNLNTMNNPRLAQALGRTATAIQARLNILGLKRQASIRERMKAQTRFAKGHVPFNKGLKGVRVSMATEFKKGNLPPNTKFDGCISIRVHKRTGTPYKYIRIAQAKWVLLHRHRWEQKHGAIPPHHIVGFKNGNTLDCRMRNLYLMSKADNARRNRNSEKALVSLKQAWREGKHFKKDRLIAHLISPRNPELKEQLMQQPELLELKRMQLKLRRELREAHAQTTF